MNYIFTLPDSLLCSDGKSQWQESWSKESIQGGQFSILLATPLTDSSWPDDWGHNEPRNLEFWWNQTLWLKICYCSALLPHSKIPKCISWAANKYGTWIYLRNTAYRASHIKNKERWADSPLLISPKARIIHHPMRDCHKPEDSACSWWKMLGKV